VSIRANNICLRAADANAKANAETAGRGAASRLTPTGQQGITPHQSPLV